MQLKKFCLTLGFLGSLPATTIAQTAAPPAPETSQPAQEQAAEEEPTEEQPTQEQPAQDTPAPSPSPQTDATEKTESSEEAPAPAAPAPSENQPKPTPPAEPAQPKPETPEKPAAEQAAAPAPKQFAPLGLMAQLASTTELATTLYNLGDYTQTIRNNPAVQLLEETLAEENGQTLDEALAENPQMAMALSLFAEEFTIALGKNSTKFFTDLLTVYQSLNEAQYEGIANGIIDEIEGSNERPNFSNMFDWLEPSMFAPILKDLAIPSTLISSKISDDDQRNMLSQQLLGQVAQGQMLLGPDGQGIAEIANFQHAGLDFSGLKIIGASVAEKFEEQIKEGMSENLGPELTNHFINGLKKANIILAVATTDTNLHLYIGPDQASLPLANTPQESLAGKGELNFAQPWLGKKLLASSYISQQLQDKLINTASDLGSICIGVKNAISEADSLGDTSDIEAMLDELIKQEKDLYKLYTFTPAKILAYREKGLHIESFGGSNLPEYDLKAPRQLAPLTEGPYTMSYSAIGGKEYTTACLQYLETLGQVAYFGAKRVSELELENTSSEMEQFKEYFTLADENISGDLVNLWSALRNDLGSALGYEGLLAMDLKGDVPAMPDIPQAVVDHAQAPRFYYAAPIQDKEKLSACWTNLNTSATNILKFLSEQTDKELPMQKPMQSESDGLATWFFPSIPGQSDNFLLSASQTEDTFYLATSKTMVAEAAKLSQKTTEPSKPGATFWLNLEDLNQYTIEWLNIIEEHGQDIMKDNFDPEEFSEKKEQITEALTGLSNLKSVKAEAYQEGDTIRNSIHIHSE